MVIELAHSEVAVFLQRIINPNPDEPRWVITFWQNNYEKQKNKQAHKTPKLILDYPIG